MNVEYRVIQSHPNKLTVLSLDNVKTVTLKVAKASEFIEGEVLLVKLNGRPTDDVVEGEVISQRIDPSFLDGTAPTLLQRGQKEFEFDKQMSFEEEQPFEDALDLLRAGDYQRAGIALREFINRYPYYIDAYHHLGLIEYERPRRKRASKYFEMGYRIGLRSLPTGFQHQLPWTFLDNRPFLRAAHAYGLSLSAAKRYIEASEVYEQILAWNPNDNQGLRYLLPDVYLFGKAPSKARRALEQYGCDGMNLYTMCLIDIMEGRQRDAFRYLCYGVSYNWHFLNMVLTGSKPATAPIRERHVTMGGFNEAAEYLWNLRQFWWKNSVREFLQKVANAEPFAHRFSRFSEIQTTIANQGRKLTEDKRRALLNESFEIFTDESIVQLYKECQSKL